MNLQVQKPGMKIACVAFAIFSMTSLVNAQKTVGDFAKNTSGTLNGTVRVVDNKGTIKYLQTANGLTTLTNTTGAVTTTTWQLGGTLTNDTYIDATGKVFALDGLALTAAAPAKSGDVASIHGGAGVGYTFLVHNELTGGTEKLLVSNSVVGGLDIFTVTNVLTLTYQISAVTAGTFSSDSFKNSVYRNGAKLLAGIDYTIDANGLITLIPNTTQPQDWALNVDDKIEVNWIR